ncbi:hypothetical protein [Methylobacterium sp. Leaf466]|uniref:hypothetical protein n=1 Tax=Methylobacterium sp. Leaf466 TaxID=1736386 RepID=UPI000AA080C5|nr:hypothetical protein [Methylobacterium sp. Leaf466]
MATKAHHRFVQRIETYNNDLELCDLLVRQFLAMPNSNTTVAALLSSTPQRHAHLGRTTNTKKSREVLGNHLKTTIHGSFIKDIFEDFSAFLSDTMTRAAMKGIDPDRFIGNVKIEIHVADLLKTGNWDDAVKMISDALFRKLENERNTRDLITKASIRLDLQLNAATLDAAMPYLDARHMLVHQDGKADDKYRRDYVAVPLRNNKIMLDDAFVVEARRTVMELAAHFDQCVIQANLVRPQDMHGGR